MRALAARVDAAERGLAARPVAALRSAMDVGAADRLQDAVAGLVGLGLGLTPAGDDVLCGLLVGLHATGRAPTAAAISAAIDLRATSRLSADLLRLAGDGHACLEVLALLAAMHRAGAPGNTDRATDRLLAIGHTSGADLATGLLLGLRTPASGAARRIGGRAA